MKLSQKRTIIVLFLSVVLLFAGLYFPKKGIAHAENSVSRNYVDCEKMISFIDNNLETFVSEYNKSLDNDEYLMASSIEYSAIINLFEDNNYGAYIDFDGQNGYLVVTDDYNIYELAVSGDLQYLRESKDIWYSYQDGFFYYGEDGTPHKFEEETSLETTAGASSGKDGEITPDKIENYIKENYPKYTISSKVVNELSKGFPYCDQLNTSYYLEHEIDSEKRLHDYSESNCSLNTMYTLLMDWQNHGFVKNLPTGVLSNLSSTIVSDPLYETYGKGRDNDNVTHWWTVNSRDVLNQMPIVYSELRDFAIGVNNYRPDIGYSDLHVIYTMQYVANYLHGNDITVKGIGVFSHLITYLCKGLSCFLSIGNSVTYGDHTVAVLGFYECEYKTGWWIFSKKEFAYFYEIADNWNEGPMFFDPNASNKLKLNVYHLDISL